MEEIWKDIPGYEGLYQASTMGRIRSVDREITYSNGRKYTYKGHVLRQNNKRWALQVQLSVNQKKKFYNVHNLVMLTFKGTRPNNLLILHEDGNFLNNELSNLRYSNASENQIDIYRQGGKTSQAKLTLDEVLFIRKLFKTGKYTQIKIGKMFNIDGSSVGRIARKDTFAWLNDDGSIQKGI